MRIFAYLHDVVGLNATVLSFITPLSVCSTARFKTISRESEGIGKLSYQELGNISPPEMYSLSTTYQLLLFRNVLFSIRLENKSILE